MTNLYHTQLSQYALRGLGGDLTAYASRGLITAVPPNPNGTPISCISIIPAANTIAVSFPSTQSFLSFAAAKTIVAFTSKSDAIAFTAPPESVTFADNQTAVTFQDANTACIIA